MDKETREQVDEELERLQERLAMLGYGGISATDQPGKNWGKVPFASTESEADEYIVQHIKEYHKLVTEPESNNVLAFSDARDDCLIAFVRHIAQLYTSGAPEERIRRDLSKIWATYIEFAKTIGIGDAWEIDSYVVADLKCLNTMKKFAGSAVSVRSANANLDIESLRAEAPLVDGRIAFGEEHAESWTEQDRKDYEDEVPWWGIKLDDMAKAIDVLSDEIPGDIDPLYYDISCATADQGDCGILRNLLSKEMNNVPAEGLHGNMAQYKSIHAFAAILTEYDAGRQVGIIQSAWPVNKVMRLFRDALEEERGFKVAFGKQPDVGVLSAVMPIWISVMGRRLLNEIEYWERHKDSSSSRTWMPFGDLATKTLKSPPILTKKRWKYWMQRCEELNAAALRHQQTTLTVESKIKFWKKSDKKQLPSTADDVEGTYGRQQTQKNVLAVHKVMEIQLQQKEKDDKEIEAYM